MLFCDAIEFGTLPTESLTQRNPATTIMKFDKLTISDAREALAYALSDLSNQALHIFTPIIVHVQKGNTHGAQDLFSIFVYHETKRKKGRDIVLQVTPYAQYLQEKDGVTARKPSQEARIGDFGQWELIEAKK